jgi:alginate O-acetyltransferase complex protein AlgI
LLTGVYAFTFQIYGDFSGYTDIARGIAKMLGFELMVNFNAPYLSRNITEFWRRWHISLSSWLRDYLYISLGGNRRGGPRTYVNLMITMFLGGLWHGAAWNFVVWGLLHGIYLAGHRMIIKGSKVDLSWPRTIPGWTANVVKMFLTFHLVAFTWVFFRAPDFSTALTYLGGFFRFRQLSDLSAPVLFAGSLMIALDVLQTWSGSHTWLTDRQGVRVLRYTVAQFMFVSVLAAAIAHIQTIVPFIYFQF